MELIKPTQHIPNDIVKILLQFDGRIKYRNGQYVNIINCRDERYKMLDKLMKRRQELIEFNGLTGLNRDNFVFDVFFKNLPNVSITYFCINRPYFDTRFDITYRNRRDSGLEFIRFNYP